MPQLTDARMCYSCNGTSNCMDPFNNSTNNGVDRVICQRGFICFKKKISLNMYFEDFQTVYRGKKSYDWKFLINCRILYL